MRNGKPPPNLRYGITRARSRCVGQRNIQAGRPFRQIAQEGYVIEDSGNSLRVGNLNSIDIRVNRNYKSMYRGACRVHEAGLD